VRKADGIYQEVQKTRLYEDVAEQIRQRIVAGSLKPGELLPPEHELSKAFGVSRAVIREAVQSLRDQRLLVVRQGVGTMVGEPGADLVGEALSAIVGSGRIVTRDLHEVRQMLEIEIAGIATERASNDDKAHLSRTVAWMERRKQSPEEYAELDLLFHTQLAAATRNEVILLVLKPLVDLLRESRLHGVQAPGAVERSLAGHRAILECLLRGDREGTRKAMLEHLNEVAERLEVVKGVHSP
jgi:GntR family transcriptional repressor for pyruvate dehydrogenase complex